MIASTSPSSNLNSDSEDSDLERQWDEYEIKLAAFKARQVEKLDAQRKAKAVQAKRDLWKAASVRYYERHPEVKEKKRIKAAEQRAAKQLARRRWDPLKKGSRSRVDLSHPVPPVQTLGGYSDVQLQDLPDVAIISHRGGHDMSPSHCPDPDPSVDAMAAESLLDLRAQPRSTSGKTKASLVDIWASLAPQYDSR
ncbi:hypothetical protein B0H14DRAFT_2559388 [Mycena olivaceomarginata]|nr:hypothetical protein B0H14DRAFT_2559388 [Mycena olivaceomarginata]